MTRTPIEQIVVDLSQEDDGTLGYVWSVFSEDREIATGAAPTLSVCVDSMREYLRSEGYAS